MAADRWERIKKLFQEALEREPAERIGFLDGISSVDPILRDEIESLLASHEEDSSLDEPPHEHLDASSLDTASVTRERKDVPDSAERAQIGPYRILREIGHGGMGVVYEAEQEKPVRRRVALKLIKLGMDTKQVIARFESERQALSLMSHTSIASVYDAGSTKEGRPYFAMEYVQGIPITDYCDTHRLKIRERLDLFTAVCEGVQHAHQKGIIHRDIKPSNILVTIQDDKPIPKIIDFGVAKATSQRLSERTVYTELGQLIGTPEYMSPEQAEMTGLDIDTRTDVYSLGVVLYELLVGAQPFDATELRRAGFDGLRRLIREKEPPKPSTRLSRLGETSSTSARNRRVEPRTLERELRGDLDWITIKALEKDRTRRYGSPVELASDIRRHLRHEPILARPPSAAYRLRKFTRRHRVGVAAAALIFVAMVIGLSGTTVGLIRATRAERKASAEAAKATAINEFLQETLGSPNPLSGVGKDVTVLESLDAAVEKIDESFADQPEIEAAVRRTIGLTYLRLKRYEDAESLLRKALEIQRRIIGNDSGAVGLMTGLGLLYGKQGNLDEAERLYRQALELARQLPDEEQGAAGEPLLNLAGLAAQRSDLDTAESMYREVLALWQKTEGEEPQAVPWAMTSLAGLLARKKNYEEAEALYREALAKRRKLHGNEHILVAGTLHGLGTVLARSDAPKEEQTAEGCEAALPLLREAMDIYEKANEASSLASVQNVYGHCLTRLRRFEEAEEQLLASYANWIASFGEEHGSTLHAARRLAELYEAWGKPEKAAEFRNLLEVPANK